MLYLCMIRKEMETIRFGQGLTKSDLCERAGVSRGTYARFLKGADISLSTLEKLSEALCMCVRLKKGGDE